jgi:hypothetical protein
LNQNNINSDRKQKGRFRGLAVTSLVIGIFMTVTTLFVWYVAFQIFWGSGRGAEDIGFIYADIGFVINFVGLLSGIIGLWSNKKKMAIVGIILCSLVYISIIYLLSYQLR